MKSVIKEKNIRLSFWILSGILPLAIFVLSTAVSGMLPGQQYCFIYGDAITQYISFAKEFWRNLFSGRSLIYSFCNGMGMPTMAINAYYSLSPFHVLCYLVPDANLAGFCIVCLKMVCSAMSMYLLLKSSLEAKDLTAVFLSAAYALCSFFSYFYIALCFTDMLYIMPLIVLALVRFVRTGKWGGLCIIYAYSFIVQFYCAYMMGIFSAIIFFTYGGYCYGKTWELWKKAVESYFICVMTAVMIASPVLVPAAYELFSMRTSDVHNLQTHILLPWTFFAGLYPGQSQEVHNEIPYMYAGMLPLLLAVVYFIDKRNGIKEKIFMAVPPLFIIMSSFIGPLYLFMHAFDAPNWYMFRFSWLLDFCIIIIAAKEIQNIKDEIDSEVRLWLISGGLVLLCLFVWLMQQYQGTALAKTMDLGCVLIVACLLLCYAALLKNCRKWTAVAVMGVLLVAELFFNLFRGQALVQDRVIRREVYDSAVGRTTENLEKISAEEEWSPTQFFRVRLSNSITDNAPSEYGYNGVGYFCSVENENVRSLLEKYGYATTTLAVYDYGSTGFMQMLFAQKYDIECGFCLVDESEHGEVRKNQYVLPLGYMVDFAMKDYHTTAENPFEAQNMLADAMCGAEHEVFVPYKGECYAIPEGVELIQYENGCKVRLTEYSGMVTYMVEPDRPDRLFSYMRRWGMTSSDMNTPVIFSHADSGEASRVSSVTMPHILPLSPDEDGFCRLFVYMDAGIAEAFDYEDIYFAYENEAETEAVYNELSSGAMNVTSFRDDRIVGEVTVSGDKTLLFTSIPYSEDWKVYVDGERVEIMPVLDDTFLGVMLEKGEHELRFVYGNKWQSVGYVIGAIGILIYSIAFVRYKKEFW